MRTYEESKCIKRHANVLTFTGAYEQFPFVSGVAGRYKLSVKAYIHTQGTIGYTKHSTLKMNNATVSCRRQLLLRHSTDIHSISTQLHCSQVLCLAVTSTVTLDLSEGFIFKPYPLKRLNETHQRQQQIPCFVQTGGSIAMDTFDQQPIKSELNPQRSHNTIWSASQSTSSNYN